MTIRPIVRNAKKPVRMTKVRPGVVLVEGSINDKDMARSCQRRIDQRKAGGGRGSIAERMRADIAARTGKKL
jgi:hypothetical protein